MNELALIFDRMGLRTKDVLEAAGTKWNFLRFSPGLVGGHCIGVDPYYLTAKAQQLGYHPQVILAGRRINDDMGKYIAQRAVKLMTHSGIALKGARVGILGVTFKENVTDTRNSRVPDIAREFVEFGIKPYVCDPIAEAGEVHEEYGIELHPWEKLSDLNAVVIAVGHDVFKAKPVTEILALLADGGVVVDVKSMLNPKDIPSHVAYWSL
jgi:UDP-N-acetyl-D-galactosamine dehydrogenase